MMWPASTNTLIAFSFRITDSRQNTDGKLGLTTLSIYAYIYVKIDHLKLLRINVFRPKASENKPSYHLAYFSEKIFSKYPDMIF